MAGFLQTADENAIRVALAGNLDDRIAALRAALDAGAESGMSDGREAFTRLLAKYRPHSS